MTARRALPSFRLTDGVIVAAIALLGLKVLGFVAGEPAQPQPPAPRVLERPHATAAAPPSSNGFARVLAHARTNVEELDEPTTTGSAPAKKDEAPPAQAEAPATREPAPPLVGPSPSERILLERLGERRDELQQRAREMEARERLIQEQERRLEERLGQLKASEEAPQPAAAPTKASGGDPAGLKNVVVMYETMKPKEAARIFDRLPIEVLLAVATQMNSRKMAEVLAVMAPENAEKLTVALARRAAGVEDVRPSPAAATLPPGELPAIERAGAPRR